MSVLLTEKDVGGVPKKWTYFEGEENVAGGSIHYDGDHSDIPFGVGVGRIDEDVHPAYLFPCIPLNHHALGPYIHLYTHPSHYIESALYRIARDHKVLVRKQPDVVLYRLLDPLEGSVD